ncbi:hypothetical protein Patl1_21815 [Pistacia atlantica]|uniref:Uncharacterized protein n=1 Tax=Pistacia atlantica TaxID=434234 RepID=A0ACC1BMH3_9ROSI|nr:hypothetical protein Patl1_21815 [Pistacia atlantica]
MKTMADERTEVEERERVGRGEGRSSINSIIAMWVPSLGTSFMFLTLSAMAFTALLSCERECSRGEDYRLIKLTVIDYNVQARKKEQAVVVECRGHDAARFHNIDHAHGWEKDVVGMVEQKHGKNKIQVSFECETLKADKAAEDHIKQFMPKLAGMDAVVNIGRMRLSGLDFEAEENPLGRDMIE